MTTFLLGLRNRHFLLLDAGALTLIPTLALILRLDSFQAVSRYVGGLIVFTLVGLAVRLLVFWRAGLYNRYWRYASVDEIALIFLSVVVATATTAVAFYGLRFLVLALLPAFADPLADLSLPRSIPLIDGLLVLTVVGSSRFSIRLIERWRHHTNLAGKRVLIVGAGDAGRMIAREMQSNAQLGLEPVGFIDDDPNKQRMKIQGLPVLGDRGRIPQLVRAYRIGQAIIAMPTAPGKTIRLFAHLCEAAGVEVKTIPGIYELLSGHVSVSQIRDVEIEDLLRREPVHTDPGEVERMIRGKRVLVTGAGGSIGSELCRQVVRCQPTELILLGHGEASIFNITRELTTQPANYPTRQSPNRPPISPIIADIRDRRRLESVFRTHRPHIVFHAAAHKHVPLMEENLEEAVANNVLGTRCLVDVAEQWDIECFVLVSTDKAVNPISVMGVTKRIAEKLVEAAAARNDDIFVAVRFGNVLGSRGSVVNLFHEQIARGGPVTVTDPDMRRYFMTIPEAVQLVLQAAAIGGGGEIFVLDMGEPVRIVDLAHDLIELSGLQVGRDIDIEYVGARPGEKLVEELFAENEVYYRTRHEKIFVARNGSPQASNRGQGSKLDVQVEALVAAAECGDSAAVRRLLHEIVPEYRSPSDPR